MVYMHTCSQQSYTENKVLFKNLQIIIILSRILKSKTHSGKVHAPCSSVQHTQPEPLPPPLPYHLPSLLLNPAMLLLPQSPSMSIYCCPAQNRQGLTTSRLTGMAVSCPLRVCLNHSLHMSTPPPFLEVSLFRHLIILGCFTIIISTSWNVSLTDPRVGPVKVCAQ